MKKKINENLRSENFNFTPEKLVLEASFALLWPKNIKKSKIHFANKVFLIFLKIICFPHKIRYHK